MLKRNLILSFMIFSLLTGQIACSGPQQSSNQPAPGSKSAPLFQPGWNMFSPQQDVEMGLQSAQKVMRETPMLDDAQISGYVNQLGQKLASKAGGERFNYKFWVVATKDINAFALPGGFLFVNAGTITAARNEGELAGVMAHEIAHAALRHGTNQATKAQAAQTGLGVIGAILSGGENPNLGQAVNTIGGLGANMMFLKFGRTAEKQADLEGARMMAEAGYDPSDMASFFKTLQSQRGQGVPEMLSDHPDPGNRIQYINAAIPGLPVSSNPVHTTNEFESVKARLTGQTPRLSSSSQLNRIGKDPGNITLGTRPQRPSTTFKGMQSNDGSFAIQVPSNWEMLSGSDSTYIFAPQGAFGKINNQLMVTHGVFVGAMQVNQRDLRSATEAFIQRQVETNPDFRVARQPQQIDFGGRQGYVSAVAGPSAINGVMEVDITYTTVTSDGRMFYFITIIPEDEASDYQQTFQQIMQNLRLAR